MSDASPAPIAGPGTTVGGYRLEGVLGQGGMGVVYRARHLTLDRPAAVKVIQPALAAMPGFRERFQRESRTAAALDHPHVVPIFDAGEAQGLLYIAMRHVEGIDLAREVQQHGPLPPERATRILAQLAAALDAAHAAGLVHRDVKPANVLLEKSTRGEHVFLTDFGVAKRSASSGGVTATGHMVGSVDYVAPEQLRGDTVDAGADVYALGCLLMQVLTGRTPFVRDSDLAVMWAHTHEPPPTVTSLAPHLPSALDPVLGRALAKRPDERFASAGDFASAVRAAVEGRTVDVSRLSAPTVAPAGMSLPRARRRRPPWLSAACGAAAVVLFSVGQLMLPVGIPATQAPVSEIRKFYIGHHNAVLAEATVDILAALCVLGFLGAISGVVRDRRDQLTGPGLAALATGVAFVVTALIERADHVATALSAPDASSDVVKGLWTAGGLLAPLSWLLLGALIVLIAAAAGSVQRISAGMVWSGLAIGSALALAALVTLPFTSTFLDALDSILFRAGAGWFVVLSIVLISQSRQDAPAG